MRQRPVGQSLGFAGIETDIRGVEIDAHSTGIDL
jgi:hypothetical protein